MSNDIDSSLYVTDLHTEQTYTCVLFVLWAKTNKSSAPHSRGANLTVRLRRTHVAKTYRMLMDASFRRL